MAFQHVFATGLLQLLLQQLLIIASMTAVMGGWLVFSASSANDQAVSLWLASCSLLNLMLVHWLVPPSVQYLGTLGQYGPGQYVVLATTGVLWLLLSIYFIEQLQRRFGATQRR